MENFIYIYLSITYLMGLGMSVSSIDDNIIADIIIFIFSPILIPIRLGVLLNYK